ncbi:hypothetical protein FACS1894208_12410 [Clostridia bacterium]|nr:hypothetical protein FACS1894208_12410 [Clostridia bacterium]
MKKRIIAIACVAMVILTVGVVAFAAATDDVVDAIGTAATGLQDQLTTIILTLLPIIIGVIILMVGVQFALKYIKKIGR